MSNVFVNAVLVIMIIVLILGVALYFLNKWAATKTHEQNQMVERTKQSVTIFVIDKKKEKAENSGLSKSVVEQLPKFYKFIKMYLVKAKVGPQIVTLITEKRVFEALPIKKNVKVELAGIYIIKMFGMKSEEEMKKIKKEKKEKEKLAKKEAK